MTTVDSPQVAVRSEGQREIVITRSFKAPRALVFDCWTKPELFARWFVRPGWTVPVLEMDVRPGGSYRYVMRQEDGSEFAMQGEYREVLRPERLVSTIAFAGFEEVGWRPEDATVSVIELVEGGAGTLMRMTQRYPSQEVRDQTLNFMETQPGASGADGYDRLAELVEERESDSEDVEVRLLPAQPMISIRATVKVADLAATMEDRMSALREYLQRHGYGRRACRSCATTRSPTSGLTRRWLATSRPMWRRESRSRRRCRARDASRRESCRAALSSPRCTPGCRRA